jgi:hypothetical protein
MKWSWPPILGLYRQIKTLGRPDGIHSANLVASQGMWLPDRHLLTGLSEVFGRPLASAPRATYTKCWASLRMYIDGNFDSLTLGIKFDLRAAGVLRQVRPDHQPRNYRTLPGP